MAQLQHFVLLLVVVTVNSLIPSVSKQVYSRPNRAVLAKDEVCLSSDPDPFKRIPGGGDRLYLFSGDCVPWTSTWTQANNWCKTKNAKLATAGHLPAMDADPLLEYVKKHNIARSWLGASKKGSKWEWQDERVLSFYSNMWHPGNPSGDGGCVEVVPEERRAYLNDRSCEAKIAFVCELNIPQKN